MPRYFFDTGQGEDDQDDFGIELPDEQAARIAGFRYLGALLRDYPSQIITAVPVTILIRDDRNRIIHRVRALDVDDLAAPNLI